MAALVSTNPLDLSDHLAAPDFIVLSFYKMFGFPDLGALIVRKPAAHVFEHRKYFGGGTTEITVTGQPWHMRKEKALSSRLEDGTGATHSILALSCAIGTYRGAFGGFEDVSKHTGWLAKCLYEKLAGMKHVDGSPVCRIYKDPASTYGDARTQGATVTFNIRGMDGNWASAAKAGAMAAARDIHIRTGSLCNPAGMACALGLTADDYQRAYASGFRCNSDQDVMNGIPTGMVRVSFGAMSALSDVEAFVRFMGDCFVEKAGQASEPTLVTNVANVSEGGEESLQYSEHSAGSSRKHQVSKKTGGKRSLRRLFASCFRSKPGQ